MPLEKLGPYQIGRVLGRGGMGAVYAAVNMETGEPAAVKVLSAGLSDDVNFRRRFEAEIETLKKLEHPNIVKLFGYGEEEGQLFFGMELVEGKSLQEEMRDGRRFTWREVVAIGQDVCAALKHAHDHGVIHRDLKPANLLLDTQGRAKLTDFGIARFFGAARLTAVGGAIGTADYMSPEQARGKNITSRSDLFSLGAVLYTLLARRTPFDASTLPAIIRKLCEEDPEPLRKFALNVPASVEDVIRQLLEKAPEKRIPTARALSNRLKVAEHLALEQENTPPSPTRPPAHPTSSPAAPPTSVRKRADAPTRKGLVEGDDADFDLADDPTGAHAASPHLTGAQLTDAPSDPNATRPSPASPASAVVRKGDPTKPVADATGKEQTGVWEGLGAGSKPQSTQTPIRENGPSTPSANTFTEVTEEDRRRAALWTDPDEEKTALWIKFAMLAGVLLVLAGGLWWAFKPVSPDTLYWRIQTAAESDDPRGLLEVSKDMESFLASYGDDPRVEEVTRLREEAEIYKLERRMQLKARRLSGPGSLSTPERLYLQSMEIAKTDPEQASRNLRALEGIFAGDQQLDESLSRVIELSRRQADRLEQQAQSAHREELAFLKDRLRYAKKAQHKNPGQARKIRQGVVDLYSEKSWAQEIVQEAKEGVEQAGSN